jgi:hypothetical protein
LVVVVISRGRVGEEGEAVERAVELFSIGMV